ncbi:MAG: SPOR domain-containing protein [Acidobacteria bacterium]|nr:SPOR domain-containing protein [Acidobacteriota bacterium]
MTEREIESGFELVLDNRKLILAFAVVLFICGCFFVWGFMAGKRQGMQLGAVAGTDDSSAAGLQDSRTSAPENIQDAAEIPPMEEDAVEQDLDWYKSVNKKEGDPAPVRPPRSPETKEAAGASSAVAKADAAGITYTVQVGAFKRRPEAEAHALDVRSKGFDSRVEPPDSPGQLYLVKVGKFDTRAEAVAEQLRLKKNGFSCFVKTN